MPSNHTLRTKYEGRVPVQYSDTPLFAVHGGRARLSRTAPVGGDASSPKLSQDALFHFIARPILVVFLITGLAVALRAKVAEPVPPPLEAYGFAATVVQGRTAAEAAFAWVGGALPSAWALAWVCVVTLVVLRVGIWAVVGMAEADADADEGARRAREVPVGRWEDGQTVSGNEILKAMFV